MTSYRRSKLAILLLFFSFFFYSVNIYTALYGPQCHNALVFRHDAVLLAQCRLRSYTELSMQNNKGRKEKKRH